MEKRVTFFSFGGYLLTIPTQMWDMRLEPADALPLMPRVGSAVLLMRRLNAVFRYPFHLKIQN